MESGCELYEQTPATMALGVVDIVAAIAKNYTQIYQLVSDKPRRTIKWPSKKSSISPVEVFANAIDGAIRGVQRNSTIRVAYIKGTGEEEEQRLLHEQRKASASFVETSNVSQKSLRELEKKMRDNVIEKLKASMIDKTRVDYVALEKEFNEIHQGVIEICHKIHRAYYGFEAASANHLQKEHEEQEVERNLANKTEDPVG